MSLLRKLIRESVRNIILETTKHDSILAALPNLMLRYEETTDDLESDITILDLFNGQDLIASATLTKLTGQLQGHPLRSLKPSEEQRLKGMSDEEYGDAVGADEDGDIRYWHNANSTCVLASLVFARFLKISKINALLSITFIFFASL